MSESEAGSASSSSSSSSSEVRQSANEVESVFLPYEDDPIADDEWSSDGSSEDEDGLSPLVLQKRFNKEDAVETWCKCKCCNTTFLESALEYRCCRELSPVLSLLLFEGINVQCITEHPDFGAMTNRTVLKHVAPLFRDKSGKKYQKQQGRSENELLRATAYRWLIRWICGYLGWENSRPLPSCIYHFIRTRLSSHNTKGYATSRERDT